MSLTKPYYPHAPIASIGALATCLGVPPKLLIDISNSTEHSYTKFLLPPKNGKEREVCEPKYELKRLQKRINSRILEKVQYPTYLQGGIKDRKSVRDYVQNSKIHAGSAFLISLDIKNFYPNIKAEYVFEIFSKLLKFPDEVANILTSLVTLNGRLPQGACTSSYIANLIFFNTEYSLHNLLVSQGYSYSRLLDDIAISSPRIISQDDSIKLIKRVAAMCTKYGLKLNNRKTKTERSDDLSAEYKVTGVWVGHGIPKLRRKDRDYIRQLVYICEKEYKKCNSSEEYHALWNRVSGQVSKLTRFEHAQAEALRLRLKAILPVFDAKGQTKIQQEALKLLRRKDSLQTRVGVINKYNSVLNALGILSRTDKAVAKSLRRRLKEKYSNIPSKAEIWE